MGDTSYILSHFVWIKYDYLSNTSRLLQLPCPFISDFKTFQS